MKGYRESAPTLRPVGRSDQGDVVRLVTDVLAEHGLVLELSGADADLADLLGNYATIGGSFDVLMDARGRTVGCVGIFPVDATICELRKLYLAPECRGRGWGRLLLEHAVDQARRRGFRTIVLETASAFEAALRMYHAYGFRPYRATAHSPQADITLMMDLASTAGSVDDDGGDVRELELRPRAGDRLPREG